MMPVVTVPSRPSGEPIATTSWPTRRLADEPRVIGRQAGHALRPDDGDVTAGIGADHGELRRCGRRRRSPVGPVPRAAPGCTGRRPLAAATTWLLVRIRPSEDRMMPGPSSDCTAHVGLQLDHAGHHLGGDLLDGAGGRLAAGTLGAAPVTLPSGRGRVRPGQQRDATADAGRHHRDRHCARRQSPCAGTLLAVRRHGMLTGCWGAPR